MSFFVGSAKSQAAQQSAVSGLQLQSSAYGKALPIVYGTTRIAPNLIWYGDFVAISHSSSSRGGGKGGGGGGGSSLGKGGGGGGSSYTYQTAVALGLCEGPIQSVKTIYANKSVTTPSALGMTVLNGTYGQNAWTYLNSVHPSQSVGYSGVAYIAASSYALGDSPQLPNHNVEIAGKFAYGIDAGIPDADPSLIVTDLLTNPHYGAGFPAERLGDLSTYQHYCLANGLWCSVAYTQQEQASSVLDALAAATNSAFVWSSGVLTLVPYGDVTISGNGYTYTAPDTPLFDLDDDDFLTPSGGDDPVQLVRKRPSDRINAVKVEWLERANSYNPAIIEAKDQAIIDAYGVRTSSSVQRHMFADVNAAKLSAQLELQRQAIRNMYYFTLDQRYVLLDPMDIVTLTDEKLGLNRQWVRITEIAEDEQGNLSFTAEEYLQGSANAALYAQESAQGFSVDANVSPGDVNPPVIFEPSAELAGALEVWVAVSGSALWGGCDVWISSNGDSYRLAGRVQGGTRTGRITNAMTAVSKAINGRTVDSINTLDVDLSESRGELLSASQDEATSLVTLCYADGELMAYRDATLASAHQYQLGWLVRGAYGSPISAHSAGAPFTRVDDSILRIPFTAESIGTTLYYKCVSFNIYGSGSQTLAEVAPYFYTITGGAYASAPRDVSNLATSYVAGITQLSWSEITDFRTVLYEIRKGDNWDGGQILGQVAHPPFVAQGNGIYWVAALCEPIAGVRTYSEHPQSVNISGAQIVSNVIAQWDEGATGWTGSTGGSAVVSGGMVRTSGTGNILLDNNFLTTADVINFGFEGDGTYQIPASHVIDIGRVAPCGVLINWSSLAQHVDNNLLLVDDILNFQDVLDFAASSNTNVYPEVSLSQDGSSWGEWQKYSPGSYVARAFRTRMQLLTRDPMVAAFLQSMTFAVDVPDRDDHYVNVAVASTGSVITFAPDGSSAPVPFNGGPAGASTMPHVQVTILNALAGDVAVISAVSLSSCTVQVLNGSSGAARHVNVLVQGY